MIIEGVGLVNKYNKKIKVANRDISLSDLAYFIADIAANHDGDIERSKDLIWKAKEAGADAVKFQHFLAKDIVSAHGFDHLGGQLSHQSTWDKSVFDVYKQYECSRDWTDILINTCAGANIDFMTTPYDAAAVDMFADRVVAFKIGSGDISWIENITLIAAQQKPVFLATGAADMTDVDRAVTAILSVNPNLVLMQCNTNYTGDDDNFNHINLNVLKTFADRYPGMVLGLSDHTPGHATVLGAIALGARVIEKHFTDDQARTGPDHGFSMTPGTWAQMVERSRELEAALGDGVKRIEGNEIDPAIVQRRCLRAADDLAAGTILQQEHLRALRPAPENTVEPYRIDDVLNRRLCVNLKKGEALYLNQLEEDA
ncbi:MAG: N-acetylneuraminate synthase family protein [Emcibacter sp.]|nr:N-acetylneuraminate synthase family protein [Emcibacter sp.]